MDQKDTHHKEHIKEEEKKAEQDSADISDTSRSNKRITVPEIAQIR